MISQAAPHRRIARFRAEVEAAIGRVVSARGYILGPEVETFENAFAGYCEMAHCIGAGSGTDALALALRACGIGRGDEVITTALTAPATGQAILQTGATPRFADVDRITRCLDPAAVADAITPRTAAIVPVHLFGHPCDMAAIMSIAHRHGLVVVEDCAQSHGATFAGRRLGSFGRAAAYSFYPTKNLGCIGDGGAVVTADAMLANQLRSLRNYGYGAERISQLLGFNSRLDEIQAAILSALLPHLDKGNAERRQIAHLYRSRLRSTDIGLPPDDPGCVYHQFALTAENRDGLIRHLARCDVGTAVHYAPALHRHPAFATAATPHLPETERLAANLISLPIQPEIAFGAADRIAQSVIDREIQCER